ncbi:MAG: TlpA family protein disulfide reductase [Limisphaerales bacterium]
MDPAPPRDALGNASRRQPRLAWASLILGGLGLVGSVAVVGGVLGLAGLVLGVQHLRTHRQGRRIGWAGVSFSGLAFVSSVAFLAFYTVLLPRMMRGDGGFQPGFPGHGSWVGREAPDFEVSRLDGSRMKLSEFRGRAVVLDFWATWCGPCVEEVPHLARLQREVGEDSLVVIGLSREDRVVLKKFAATRDVPYPLASLEHVDLPEPYSGVRAYPTTFFLDASGVIREVVVGYQDFDSLRRLATAVGETGPTPAAAR